MSKLSWWAKVYMMRLVKRKQCETYFAVDKYKALYTKRFLRAFLLYCLYTFYYVFVFFITELRKEFRR